MKYAYKRLFFVYKTNIFVYFFCLNLFFNLSQNTAGFYFYNGTAWAALTATTEHTTFIALKNHDLKVGDRVKIISKYSSELYNIANIENNGFYITGAIFSNVEKLKNLLIAEETVFVYGKLVSNFHTVNYEALSTLNISATQALLKRLNDAEAKVKMQENRLDEQASRLNKLEAIIFKTTAAR